MAKQIKVIKCPNCGSVQNRVIKEDHYRCDSCGTEYFLDNDDVNINVTHHHGDSKQEKPAKKQKSYLSMWLTSMGVMIGVAIISAVLEGSNKSAPKPDPASSSYTANTNTPTKPKIPVNKYSDKASVCYPIISTDNKTVTLFDLSYRTYGREYDKDPRNGYISSFKNLLTGKVINETPMDVINNKSGLSYNRWKSRLFEDNKLYIILNQRDVYRLDPITYHFENITNTLFNQQSELQSGIATIGFVNDSSNSGFTILTNDGKKVIYFPIVNKAYTDDEFYNARNNFETLLPNAVNKFYYAFTNPSIQNRKHPIELLKITYKDNIGGPKNINTNPSWFRGYSPEIKSNVSDTSEFKILSDKWYYRIIAHKDLTPGRLYFSPSVFYYDQDNLFIKVKVNAAPDAIYNLQRIDINSGKVIWSIPSDELNISSIKPYGNGFLAQLGWDCNTFAVIDAAGNISKTIKLKSE